MSICISQFVSFSCISVTLHLFGTFHHLKACNGSDYVDWNQMIYLANEHSRYQNSWQDDKRNQINEQQTSYNDSVNW